MELLLWPTRLIKHSPPQIDPSDPSIDFFYIVLFTRDCNNLLKHRKQFINRNYIDFM